MKQSDANELSRYLVDKFGLSVKATVSTDSNRQYFLVEPTELHPNEGFHIYLHIGWRSIKLEFVPGKFAGELVASMGNANIEQKQVFTNLTKLIQEEKGQFTFKVNNNLVDPLHYESWPENWNAISFLLKKSPLEINTEDNQLTKELLFIWIERFFACVLTLMPLELNKSYSDDFQGLPEGAVERVVVNRYERNRYNRTICINIHGYKCKVCDMDFFSKYGKIGENFIHVHHITPVSKIGQDYQINPVSDLVPVCPNCHAMLHKNDPPYSVDELRKILLERQT